MNFDFGWLNMMGVCPHLVFITWASEKLMESRTHGPPSFMAKHDKATSGQTWTWEMEGSLAPSMTKKTRKMKTFFLGRTFFLMAG